MAIRQKWAAVTNAATPLTDGITDDSRSDWSLTVRNESNVDVFIGGSNVTTDTAATQGFKLRPGEVQGFALAGGDLLYGRAATAGPHSVSVLASGVA